MRAVISANELKSAQSGFGLLALPRIGVSLMSLFTVGLGQKRLDLLRQLVSRPTLIAMLVNPNFPDAETEVRAVETAAQALEQKLILLNASVEAELDAAFASLVRTLGRL
jgi:putative tryptophan/tyrosine transport system substrate-binding protein